VAHRAQPPGSTVKPLVYAAALREDSWAADRTISCSGKIASEPDWTCVDVHGETTLVGAIATSCNVYGWQIADALGPVGVRRALGRAGLTKPTGLVPDEDSGALEPLAPSGKQQEQNRLIALGHGGFRVTPLHLAFSYARLVADPEFEAGELSSIREGLIQAVTRGTAQGASTSGLEVMGKTGSAEPAGSSPSDDVPGNAWFVGVAPVDDPQIVVVVLVRGGKSGGQVAAPLASRVLERWARDRASK
jgi:cell division protein FtsI/penicillin-binding protein 2